jgi:hypothetical protein
MLRLPSLQKRIEGVVGDTTLTLSWLCDKFIQAAHAAVSGTPTL